MLFPVWLGLGFLLFVLEWLSQVFALKVGAGTVLMLYAYKIPSHLQLAFPVAVLFSCLVVLSTMNRFRETTAVQSFGMKMGAIFLPSVAAVLLAGIPYYWIVHDVAPWGLRQHYELYDIEVSHVPSRFGQVRQEKMWYRNKDILYNVGYFAADKNELVDVTIYTFDDQFNIAQTIFAAKAGWNGTNWVLSDGNITLTDPRVEVPVSEAFKTRSTGLIEDPKNLKRVEFNAETMGQSELWRAIARHHALGINTASWEVVYHSRYSFFLISLVFLSLAFPRAMRFRRGSTAAIDGVFVATVCMAYWLIFSYCVNLGNNGKLNPLFAAWGPSILFLVAVMFYNRNRSLKSESE